MPRFAPATEATAGRRNDNGRQIDATDRQIDQLVYNLYDLTEEEIKIVEKAIGTDNATEVYVADHLNLILL